MTDQLSLPGFAAESPPTDGLFFAVFPEADAAERIACLARSLRAEHRLAAEPLAAERFHVTLYSLGEYEGLPAGVVNAAREAASAVEASPFDVAFDRFGSFSSRSGKHPLVLRGGDGLVGLRDLRRTLGLAMARAGLGRWVGPSFTPHMTLLYGDRVVVDGPIEAPGWRVGEFVLARSLLGQTRHVALGRWSLRG